MVATSWFQAQQPYCLVCKSTAAQSPQLMGIQIVWSFAQWAQMLTQILLQWELGHQPQKHLFELLGKMRVITWKEVQSCVHTVVSVSWEPDNTDSHTISESLASWNCVTSIWQWLVHFKDITTMGLKCSWECLQQKGRKLCLKMNMCPNFLMQYELEKWLRQGFNETRKWCFRNKF